MRFFPVLFAGMFIATAALAQPMPLEAVQMPPGAAPAPLQMPSPSTPPSQAGGKDMIAIFGHGNSKCTDYLNYRGRGQEMVTKNYQIWLNGFISSYNTFTSPTGNVTQGRKADEMMRWIEGYCKANPDNFFQRATIEMLRALESGRF